MILLFTDSTYITNSSTISDVSGIANIIIAAISLGLAYYIFVYQKNKDNRDKATQLQKEQDDKIEATKLQEQNIRLQWFKELVIQPHLSDINHFYNRLHTLESQITTVTLSDQQKIDLIDFIKAEQAKLRKSFVDVLLGVNPQLYTEVINNLDTLTDSITNTIFNDGLNLTHKPTYEREIGSKISYSRNDLISKIYSFKGTA
jgi:hypothetical protein